MALKCMNLDWKQIFMRDLHPNIIPTCFCFPSTFYHLLKPFSYHNVQLFSGHALLGFFSFFYQYFKKYSATLGFLFCINVICQFLWWGVIILCNIKIHLFWLKFSFEPSEQWISPVSFHQVPLHCVSAMTYLQELITSNSIRFFLFFLGWNQIELNRTNRARETQTYETVFDQHSNFRNKTVCADNWWKS